MTANTSRVTEIFPPNNRRVEMKPSRNEVHTLNALTKNGAEISILTSYDDNPTVGKIVWSDLNNIAVRTGKMISVLAKQHIVSWTYNESEAK